MFFERFMKWFAQKWAVNDTVSEGVDVIVAISYAATKNRLTHSSFAVANKAKNLQEINRGSKIFWGVFSKKNTQLEERYKSSFFGEKGVFVGDVSSSTDECEAVVTKLSEDRGIPECIVVIAEGAHSRRCKLVWKHTLPGVKIYFQSIPSWQCGDPENPMWVQQSWEIWLLVNIMAYPFYRWWPGVGWFAKHNPSQPT